jgi:Ala-tRNA(Pro) deacylase
MKICNFLWEQEVNFKTLPHRPVYDAQHVAQELHVPGAKVAKTVLLRANHGYGYLVAVVPASKRVDLERLSHLLNGCELALATESEIVERCPDCEFGVLPPFGSFYAMQTVMDESLTGNEDIVFEGNTHHEAIRMSVDDFMRLEEPLVLSFVDVGAINQAAPGE